MRAGNSSSGNKSHPSLKRQLSSPNPAGTSSSATAGVPRTPAPSALSTRRKRNVALLELRVNNVSVLVDEDNERVISTEHGH
jgi:hypothetical protein